MDTMDDESLDFLLLETKVPATRDGTVRRYMVDAEDFLINHGNADQVTIYKVGSNSRPNGEVKDPQIKRLAYDAGLRALAKPNFVNQFTMRHPEYIVIELDSQSGSNGTKRKRFLVNELNFMSEEHTLGAGGHIFSIPMFELKDGRIPEPVRDLGVKMKVRNSWCNPAGYARAENALLQKISRDYL